MVRRVDFFAFQVIISSSGRRAHRSLWICNTREAWVGFWVNNSFISDDGLNGLTEMIKGFPLSLCVSVMMFHSFTGLYLLFCTIQKRKTVTETPAHHFLQQFISASWLVVRSSKMCSVEWEHTGSSRCLLQWHRAELLHCCVLSTRVCIHSHCWTPFPSFCFGNTKQSHTLTFLLTP